jgi:hypothetical protein
MNEANYLIISIAWFSQLHHDNVHAQISHTKVTTVPKMCYNSSFISLCVCIYLCVTLAIIKFLPIVPFLPPVVVIVIVIVTTTVGCRVVIVLPSLPPFLYHQCQIVGVVTCRREREGGRVTRTKMVVREDE